MMAFVDLLIVSTEENRGHTGSSSSSRESGANSSFAVVLAKLVAGK